MQILLIMLKMYSSNSNKSIQKIDISPDGIKSLNSDAIGIHFSGVKLAAFGYHQKRSASAH